MGPVIGQVFHTLPLLQIERLKHGVALPVELKGADRQTVGRPIIRILLCRNFFVDI